MRANWDDAGTNCRDDQENDQEDTVVTEQWAQAGYIKVVRNALMKHALDPKLIATIIFVESGGNHTAVSRRGAKGLMQLTPAVYRQYGVDDPFDIEQNIHVGTAYFSYLLEKFDGNLAHALAAYNCGPTRVVEHNGIPPIRETRNYVKRVLEFYQKEKFSAGLTSRKS
jgi:soluble lytic murein transglycosylase-like protein